MKAKIFVLFAVLLAPSFAVGEDYDIDDLMKSSVRVEGTKKELNALGIMSDRIYYGSGTFIGKAPGKYYILTNGHVVSKMESISVQYMTADRVMSAKVPAKVRYIRFLNDYSSNDFAVLTVLSKDLGSYTPKVIPLGKKGDVVAGDFVFGCGYPSALWCQFWLSKINSVDEEGRLFFSMPPIGGQSGSAIIKKIGGKLYVVGVVTWHLEHKTNGSRYGGGVVIDTIRDAEKKSVLRYFFKDSWDWAVERTGITRLDFADVNVCSPLPKGCGQPKAYHFVVIERATNQPVLDKDGQMRLLCPNKELTGPATNRGFPISHFNFVRYDFFMGKNQPPGESPLEEDGIPPEIFAEEEEPTPPVQPPVVPQPDVVVPPVQPPVVQAEEEEKSGLLGRLGKLGLLGATILTGGGIGIGALSMKGIAWWLAKRAAKKAALGVASKVRDRVSDRLEDVTGGIREKAKGVADNVVGGVKERISDKVQDIAGGVTDRVKKKLDLDKE